MPQHPVQTPAQGAPPPPPNPAIANLQIALKVPSWEDIVGLLHSPALRQFRVDVETDSMIAGTLQSDMQGLATVLEGVTKTIEGLAPIVQSGALPADAVKEIVMTVIRRARMGTAVEDAFDKLQAPKPPPNPEQVKAQAEVAKVNAQAQADAASDQARTQADITIAKFEQQGKQQLEQMRQQGETNRQMLSDRFDAMVKIIVATITATKQPDQQVQGVADRTVAGNGAGA